MITPKDLNNTYNYLRKSTKPWKESCKRKHNGKCVVTGTKDNLQVHHLQKSFMDMVDEALELASLDYRPKINQYDDSERQRLTDACKEVHSRYDGVPVCVKFHKKFHERYGIRGYTEEDFRKFCKLYRQKYRESRRYCN